MGGDRMLAGMRIDMRKKKASCVGLSEGCCVLSVVRCFWGGKRERKGESRADLLLRPEKRGVVLPCTGMLQRVSDRKSSAASFPYVTSLDTHLDLRNTATISTKGLQNSSLAAASSPFSPAPASLLRTQSLEP